MRLRGVIWLGGVVDKIAVKHGIETSEVEELLDNKPKIRFVEKGERKGEDVYLAEGQTNAGRYSFALFIFKASGQALILSARDMTSREKKRYGKK